MFESHDLSEFTVYDFHLFHRLEEEWKMGCVEGMVNMYKARMKVGEDKSVVGGYYTDEDGRIEVWMGEEVMRYSQGEVYLPLTHHSRDSFEAKQEWEKLAKEKRGEIVGELIRSNA
ncbi:hypothetical protein PIB30_024855 [Stylosanthes scabra]|uniref:Uncharacterized protein n=1 Tax=Stylosanthes scabra TaxID=79078 RepID=A0ABU6Z8X5_9FABA|nr:hypothetical protein [Stylosanthes scabra]